MCSESLKTSCHTEFMKKLHHLLDKIASMEKRQTRQEAKMYKIIRKLGLEKLRKNNWSWKS